MVWLAKTAYIHWGLSPAWVGNTVLYETCIDCSSSSSDCYVSTVVIDLTNVNKNAILKDLVFGDDKDVATYYCQQKGLDPTIADLAVALYVNSKNSDILSTPMWYCRDDTWVATATGNRSPAISPLAIIRVWTDSKRYLWYFDRNILTSYLEIRARCKAGRVCCCGVMVLYSVESSPRVVIEAVKPVEELRQIIGGAGIRAGYALWTPINEAERSTQLRNRIDIILSRREDVDRVVDVLSTHGLDRYIIDKIYE